MSDKSKLEMFVVYRNPKDFPDKIVVRKWTVDELGLRPEPKAEIVCETLEEARKSVPPYAYRQPRFPDDDPCIEEVWF